MKIKQGYVIKRLGAGYVVVTVGQASKEFNGLIRLDQPGAFLWGLLEHGPVDRDGMVAAMMERYEDLDEATARQDLDEFLKAVEFALEE